MKSLIIFLTFPFRCLLIGIIYVSFYLLNTEKQKIFNDEYLKSDLKKRIDERKKNQIILDAENYDDFDEWFADCIIYAVNNPSNRWDNYLWDINNNNYWLDFYNKGLKPSNSVNLYFKIN